MVDIKSIRKCDAMSQRFNRSDVVSYLVDCLCFPRDEAEAMVGNYSYEEFLSQSQIVEMKEFLGIVTV